MTNINKMLELATIPDTFDIYLQIYSKGLTLELLNKIREGEATND